MSVISGYNRYIPPNYDGKRTLNQMAGKAHGLGNRARKIALGILIVRFEAPMDMSCSKCRCSIAQGVRFNAEKKKVGYYFSTPIWSFRVKCKNCGNEIEIQTDPQNARYRVTSGAVEKTSPERHLNNLENRTNTQVSGIQLQSRISNTNSGSVKIRDGFEALERNDNRRSVRMSREREIQELYERNARQWRDSYAASQRLREKFRQEKHIIERKNKANLRLKNKHSLHLTPALESSEDRVIAHANTYGINLDTDFDREVILKSILSSDLYHRKPVIPTHIATPQSPMLTLDPGTLSSPLTQSLKKLKKSKFKSQAMRSLATQVDISMDPFSLPSFSKTREVKRNNNTNNLFGKVVKINYNVVSQKKDTKLIEKCGIKTPNDVSLVCYNSDSD